MLTDSGIHSTQNVIQENDITVCVHGSGQVDSGLLTSGKSDTTFTDFGLITFWKVGEIDIQGTGSNNLVVLLLIPLGTEQHVLSDSGVLHPGIRAESQRTVHSGVTVKLLHRPVNGIKKRSLTGTNGPGDDDQFPLLHFEIDVLQTWEGQVLGVVFFNTSSSSNISFLLLGLLLLLLQSESFPELGLWLEVQNPLRLRRVPLERGVGDLNSVTGLVQRQSLQSLCGFFRL
ncbi:hypothetical protein WICPIJ_009642 [Wickerhamomyces pijperi]|uniref:Uncharacterized protein n=1 Tax=Wickerhamomyces pijperi TaxID=599730 RepID=A0A9P8PLT8_WICPI|nr:hypothetical protein WICPIJ_009642 [Wickerhamomyces pijperi]